MANSDDLTAGIDWLPNCGLSNSPAGPRATNCVGDMLRMRSDVDLRACAGGCGGEQGSGLRITARIAAPPP